MRITSPAFSHNAKIPKEYTCDGSEIMPEIKVHDMPDTTESLVLIMEDIDVNTSVRPSGLWTHLLLWNIPPEVEKIGQEELSMCAVGMNSAGDRAYQGPCPPQGEHRYVFTLYALDSAIEPTENTDRDDLIAEMNGRIIETAELVGKYRRVG